MRWSSGWRGSSVNFVDSPRLLRDLKPTVEPLHSRTGTHWNYYACFLVWREALKKINACSSLRIPVPELAGVEYDKPRGTDNDLGSLLNVFVLPSGTPRIPYPIVETTPKRRPAFCISFRGNKLQLDTRGYHVHVAIR